MKLQDCTTSAPIEGGSALNKCLHSTRLYLETIRHLKPRQLFWRGFYKFCKPRKRKITTFDTRPKNGTWQEPLFKPASWLGDLRFRFLNVELALHGAGGWNDSDTPKLWLYNLHYFDWLQSASVDEDPEGQLSLMRLWAAQNPFGSGNGWEPYPVSLRIVNWVKFALRTGALPRDLASNLALQIDYLSQRVEYDLLGNHLMANAKGLLFGGWFFQGAAADRWARLGLELMRLQMDEQILPDGGHFERSAMYHAIILEDILDLINLARTMGQPVPAQWTDALPRMRRWLLAMTHDDGCIALFNDAAFDVAPQFAELEAYARRLDLPPAAPLQPGLLPLTDSGYFRWKAGSALLIGDVGALGPDYQPGHGHADTLSFELSIGPDRLIVDSGTSTYAAGMERLRQRSTHAHNTVIIDSRDSSEVWGSFRVGRRARICELKISDDGSGICATHNGYRWLPGRPLHRRCWHLAVDGLELIDQILGDRSHFAAMAFHFHPSVKMVLDGAEVVGSAGGSTFRARLPDALAWTIQQDEWHPRFGQQLPNLKLVGEAMIQLPCRLTTRFIVSIP